MTKEREPFDLLRSKTIAHSLDAGPAHKRALRKELLIAQDEIERLQKNIRVVESYLQSWKNSAQKTGAERDAAISSRDRAVAVERESTLRMTASLARCERLEKIVAIGQ